MIFIDLETSKTIAEELQKEYEQSEDDKINVRIAIQYMEKQEQQ